MTETTEQFVVACRVRPFNAREKDRGAKCILSKEGNTLHIVDPDNPDKEKRSVTFNHMFWSHDGFKEREDGILEATDQSDYADQHAVYNKVGKYLLDGFMDGYNTSFITYGQTGAGKSYTLTGYGANKGLMSLFNEDMFQRLEAMREQGTDYHVTISMIELYLEKVRDLLNDPRKTPKGGLKVRENATLGTYVSGLKEEVASGASDVRRIIEKGTNHRTIAATQMNATSSRAHTLIFIHLRQRTGGTTIESKIVFADLAGSERTRSIGATGDRLKEGAMINMSLSSLGSILHALAQRSKDEKKRTIVPYRNSTLTRLLKEYLDGKARVVMFVNVSPADINYEETLSSMRYGRLATGIRVNPEKNQYSSDAKLQELKQEVETLRSKEAETSEQGGMGAINQYLQDMEEKLKQLQGDEEILSMPWWKKKSLFSTAKEEDLEKQREEDKQKYPYFWNLAEDQTISGTMIHFVKIGKAVVGMSEANPSPDIALQGLGIEAKHCEILDRNGSLSIIQVAKNIMVNGKLVTTETKLEHNDRIWFAPSNLYVFHVPHVHKRLAQGRQKVDRPSFDKALLEIIQNTDKISGSKIDFKADPELQDRLIELLPKVLEVSTMASVLKKDVKFEVALISPESRGMTEGKVEEMVKIVAIGEDGQEGNDWLWDLGKFDYRYLLMQEIYQAYAGGSKDWDVPQYKDPFWEHEDTDKIFGSCSFELHVLVCTGEVETADIMDYTGKKIGQLSIQCDQCDHAYQPLDLEDYILYPNQMQGRPLYLTLTIQSATDLPANVDTSYCRYKFFKEQNYTQTNEFGGTLSPQYNFTRKISFSMVSIELSNYFKNEKLFVEVMGKQKREVSSGLAAGAVMPSTLDELEPEKPLPPTKQDNVQKKELQVMSQRMRRQGPGLDTRETTIDQSQAPEPLPKEMKAKDEQNLRIKQTMESKQEDERLKEKILNYLRHRQELGHTAIRIEDITALLEGSTPPGRPVERESTPASVAQSKPQSQACNLQ